MLSEKYDVPGMRGAAESFLTQLTEHPSLGKLTWCAACRVSPICFAV